MKADLSRHTFAPEKHYRDVRLQQGRVQLDADFNEYVDITARRIETGTRDLIGHCCAPEEGGGFQLGLAAADLPAAQQAAAAAALAANPLAGVDFLISAGRYYVDGLMVENDAPLTYKSQGAGDWPGAGNGDGDTDGLYLVYLDVWLRHLTHLDDPALREVALNGPDTATRQKVLWQVKRVRVAAAAAAPDCGAGYTAYTSATAAPTGRLAADVDPTPPADKPCELSPGGGYRRLENQLYRVEIHAPGNANGAATFKWSRDNGTVVSGWAPVAGEPRKVRLLHPPRDQVLGFAKGQWVELLDDVNDLTPTPGTMLEVVDVKGDVIELSADVPAFARRPKIRRWDGATGVAGVATGAPIVLEDGVRVTFTTGSYRTGDHWLIPARTARADVEWPRTNPADPTSAPLPLPPLGIRHHFCRLGFVRRQGGVLSAFDCRCLYPALAAPRLEMVGGDGQEVMPDLTQPAQVVRLPEPIAVFAQNLHCGEGPLSLRFTVEPATDELQLLGGSGASAVGGVLTVPAPESGGVVQCIWRLRPSVLPPEPPPAALGSPFTDAPGGDVRRYVRVQCVNAAGAVVESPHPLLFTARLSVASQVAYDPGACPTFAQRRTVQAAIDLLVGMASLYKVSGDGGIGYAREERTVTVLAANRCGPVAGLRVQFSVLSGGGSLASAAATTGPDGRATTSWRLGTQTDVQLVLAEFAATGQPSPVTEPRRVVFVVPVGGDPAPIHIEKLEYGRESRPLVNDATTLTLQDLMEGIRVILDDEVDAATVVDPVQQNTDILVRGQPTCFITAELPYPGLLGPSFDLPFFAGYSPLILHAGVTAKGNVIEWRLDRLGVGFIDRTLRSMLQVSPRLDRVLLRLTLKGSFIVSTRAAGLFERGTPGGYLDGETWRAPEKNSPHQLMLPSGDCRRGGDFEMWFWLRPTTEVRPTPSGPGGVVATPVPAVLTPVTPVVGRAVATEVTRGVEALPATPVRAATTRAASTAASRTTRAARKKRA